MSKVLILEYEDYKMSKEEFIKAYSLWQYNKLNDKEYIEIWTYTLDLNDMQPILAKLI